MAIELVDLGGGEVEEILAGDIFHRHVILGPADRRGVAPADLRGEIALGDEAQYVDDPLALVGDPVAALAHLATHLAAFGETVRAGDVLITGSIVPALVGRPGTAPRVPPRAARRARRCTFADEPGGAHPVAILREPSRRWRNW